VSESQNSDSSVRAAAPAEADVMDALANVIDPELGLDFVELGLIYGVEVNEGDVHVTFTLTTPGCPIGPQVTEQIDEFVGELEGVKSVSSEMVFTPPWSPERMTEDAKFALGFRSSPKTRAFWAGSARVATKWQREPSTARCGGAG
jgi:metal-sulfur cluster biosynthetic enzyme